jgi:hypothetical protein
MVKKKGSALPPTNEAVIAALHQLSAELSGTLPVDEIVAAIPELMTHPKGHMQLLEVWLPKAPGHEQELANLLLLLWNTTPQADQGGLTALELAAQPQKEAVAKASQSKNKASWLQLMPLLEDIQGFFQEAFFPAYESLPKKKRETLLNGAHLLFFRYWHTACPDLMDWPPALIIEQERQARRLTLAKSEHVFMRMYRNPELPDDPRHNLRTSFGQEADTYLPLCHDLAHPDSSYFWADGDYIGTLNDLNQHLGTKKKEPAPKEVLQFVLESSLAQWFAEDEYASEHFSERSWYIFWKDMLQRPLEPGDNDDHGWWVVDNIFSEVDKRTGQTGTKSLFAFDGVLQGNNTDMQLLESAIGKDGVSDNLRAMFYFGCNFFQYLVVPLGLYLPVLQPLWQDPIDIAEEVDDFRYSKSPLVEAIAKPPALLRPTTYGAKLIASLKAEPQHLG